MYALVDCNSFYASCEKVFIPSIQNKPVVVLSNNDGCIIARSKEAKALGVKMGEPYFKRKAFFKKNKISVFSANFTLYGDLSERVMQTLSTFTPDIEVYSIDESFLDLSGFEDLKGYGMEIKNRIYKWVGIPVSVGIAPTKTLAKLANHIAKKKDGFNGCCYLEDMGQVNSVCGHIDIAEVWGIGSRYARMLARRNVFTVADFKGLPEKWVYKNMTVVGLRTFKELHGKPCIALEDTIPNKKAICTSRSFGKPLKDLSNVQEALATFGSNASRKLRAQGSFTSLISVFLETNPFQLDKAQYKNSQVIRLPFPTNSSLVINQYANFALKQIFRKGYEYKKTGILLMDFTPQEEQQLNLFASYDVGKHKKIMEVCDMLNARHHRKLIKTGLEGTKEKFKMRQEKLSPCYTTRIIDIPLALSG